jgi:hypothetical protein
MSNRCLWQRNYAISRESQLPTTGPGPIRQHLKIAHALNGRVPVLTYDGRSQAGSWPASRRSYRSLGEVHENLCRQWMGFRCFLETIQERPIGNLLPRLVDRSGLSKKSLIIQDQPA